MSVRITEFEMRGKTLFRLVPHFTSIHMKYEYDLRDIARLPYKRNLESGKHMSMEISFSLFSSFRV